MFASPWLAVPGKLLLCSGDFDQLRYAEDLAPLIAAVPLVRRRVRHDVLGPTVLDVKVQQEAGEPDERKLPGGPIMSMAGLSRNSSKPCRSPKARR